MYTKHKAPGKFEGNESRMLATAVYNTSLNGCCEELGESEGFGWYAYVSGKRYDFIVCENSQGFVYVDYGKPDDMQKKWDRIAAEYDVWESEGQIEED